MSNPGRELYREGFLQKAGKRSFQAWRKRWFILNGTIVKYYPSQEITKANLLGTIDMSEVTNIVVSRSVKNGFEIATQSRTYSVSAKSEGERSEWMSILKRASQIGQQVQRQRSLNPGSRDPSIDVSGEDKPTVSPSSLYETLKEAESSKEGRSFSKTSQMLSTSSSRPPASIPISIHKSQESDDADNNPYDVPKSPFSLTDDEDNINKCHYKSPKQLSVDENQWRQNGPSSSEDELDYTESHKKRFSKRHHSIDSIATIDSADYTEIESDDSSNDDDDDDDDEIDGDNDYDTIDRYNNENIFLPLPRSDDGKYAVEEIKVLTQSSLQPTNAEIDNIILNLNCKYADPEYPAFSALKTILKL